MVLPRRWSGALSERLLRNVRFQRSLLMICGAMPNPGLCRIDARDAVFGVELLTKRDQLIRHSPRESEALQKGQQVIVGLIAACLGIDRRGFGKDLLFDSEIGVQVDLRCFDGFVPQPKCY